MTPEFGKKAQGTVYATDGLERDQEWMCMRCGKWFPSRAACIGHQSVHGREPTRKLAAGSQCSICRTEIRMRERLRRHLRYGTRRCVQARKLSALTQPRRPRREGARGQGLQDVNEPNNVRMTGASMTAMPPVSTPMPALTMVPWVDDFDWSADAAFIGLWWNGGRDDSTSRCILV